MNGSALLIFDIDNTLVASYGIYDEAYRLTSKELLGKEFIMTKHPDGTPDLEFSKKSNPEILLQRLEELGLSNEVVTEEEFFSRFDKNAELAAKSGEFFLFPGVKGLLESLSQKFRLILLTSGSRKLQITVLERAGILPYFDLSQSFFLGDYHSKQEAIETTCKRSSGVDLIAYFGDAPNDMRAIKQATISVQKIAIGVTVAGLVSPDQLTEAGADYVINEYTSSSHSVFKEQIGRLI